MAPAAKEYLIWDREARVLLPGSPFPTSEDAHAHVERQSALRDGYDPRYDVVAVNASWLGRRGESPQGERATVRFRSGV